MPAAWGLGLGCPWPCFSCQLRQPCAKARVSFLAVACSTLLKPLALPTAGEAAAVRPHLGQVVSSALLQSHTTLEWESSVLYITASTCRTGLRTLGLTAAGGAAAVRPHSGQVMSSALLQSHAASVWEPPALYHHCNHLQDWDGSPWPCCSRWSSCSQIAVSIFGWPCCSRWSSCSQLAVSISDWPCCSRWSSCSQFVSFVILALLQQVEQLQPGCSVQMSPARQD